MSWSRRWWVPVLLVAVLGTGYLLAPLPPTLTMERDFATIVPLAGPFRAVLNIDSPRFLQGARDPSLLLYPRFYRQNRPVYMLAGWTLAQPIRLLDSVLGIHRDRDDVFPEWAGMVAFNILVLLAGLWGFQRLMPDGGVSDVVLAALLTFLVANDLVKVYLFTPHTQMFAVTTPIVVALCVRWALQHRQGGVSGVVPWALILGLCGLCYESAVIGIPLVAAALLVRGREPGGEALGFRATQAAAFAAAALAPMAVWQGVVRVATGDWITPPEIRQHRELVWMLDAAGQGASALASAAADNLRAYSVSVAAAFAPLVPLFAVAAGLRWLAPGPRAGRPLAQARFDRAALWCFAVFFVFFGVLGYYTPRLAWNSVPLLLVWLGPAIDRVLQRYPVRARTAAVVVIGALAVLQAAWQVAKAGPYAL